MKGFRLASLACIALVAIGAALAPATGAEKRSKRDPADVRSRGLTGAERRALDITRVTTETPGGMLLVRVALRGDFDRVVGGGHLRTALAGIVLHPRSRRADPLAIVSTGAGRRERTVASRRVRGPEVALRQGRQITFYAPGLDASRIRRVEAKTFAAGPRRAGARGAQLVGGPVASLIGYFLDADGADRSDVPVDETSDEEDAREREERCRLRLRELGIFERELDRLRRERARAIADGRKGTTRELTRVIGRVERYRDDAERDAALCNPPSQTIEGEASMSPDPNDSFEVFLDLVFSGGGTARASQAGGVDAIRVVLPPAADGTTRTIINWLPPPQLPTCGHEQPNVLICHEGSLAYGQATQMKLRMTPAPSAGMGGELFGRVGGSFRGPIRIAGP